MEILFEFYDHQMLTLGFKNNKKKSVGELIELEREKERKREREKNSILDREYCICEEDRQIRTVTDIGTVTE